MDSVQEKNSVTFLAFPELDSWRIRSSGFPSCGYTVIQVLIMDLVPRCVNEKRVYSQGKHSLSRYYHNNVLSATPSSFVFVKERKVERAAGCRRGG